MLKTCRLSFTGNLLRFITVFRGQKQSLGRVIKQMNETSCYVSDGEVYEYSKTAYW